MDKKIAKKHRLFKERRKVNLKYFCDSSILIAIIPSKLLQTKKKKLFIEIYYTKKYQLRSDKASLYRSSIIWQEPTEQLHKEGTSGTAHLACTNFGGKKEGKKKNKEDDQSSKVKAANSFLPRGRKPSEFKYFMYTESFAFKLLAGLVLEVAEVKLSWHCQDAAAARANLSVPG